jgi:recombinational DNA repair protein (RecF pathway)
MHTIYHTKAVIIKSLPSGESNKLFWLFTQELGLIVAVATGVRKGTAKLKGQLVDYAFIDVDLVKGKDVWRLVSATLQFNPLADDPAQPLARPYVRTLATLERFLVDEGVHAELYAHIEECARILTTDAGAKVFDTLAIWRTLVHLGYVAIEEHELPLFTLSFEQALATIDEPTIKKFIILVNETIKQTHL